jgi:hypothetical protein
MKIGRRKFFQVFTAAPLVAKQAAEQVAGRLAGMADLDMPGFGVPRGSAPSSSAEPSTTDFQRAFLDRALRPQLERLIYEEERYIGRIDPDLAVLRSFSLSAKIAFQRQKNVALRIEQMQQEWPWQRLNKLVKGGIVGKLLGLNHHL